MDNETFVKAAKLFLRHGSDKLMGVDGSYRIDMDDVSFNWNPRRDASDPSYEFFSGPDWAVSRMYQDTIPYLRVVGDEEAIQQDIDRVLVLRVLDGTFPQDILTSSS